MIGTGSLRTLRTGELEGRADSRRIQEACNTQERTRGNTGTGGFDVSTTKVGGEGAWTTGATNATGWLPPGTTTGTTTGTGSSSTAQESDTAADHGATGTTDSGPTTTDGADASSTKGETSSSDTLDDTICRPGERWCEADAIMQCSGDGTEKIEIARCTADQVCNNATAPCDEQRCIANQPACDGTVATLCNGDGTGFVPGGTDCTPLAKVCRQGQCIARLCDPNAYWCVDGNVHRCAADGLTSTLIDTCSSSQRCEPGNEACVSLACDPGQPYCAGEWASICNADGTGALPGAIDCTMQDPAKICIAGDCVAQACRPREHVCISGDVHRCHDDATHFEPVDACGWREYCEAGLATCLAEACTPGADMCDAEQNATHCLDDASGPAPGGTSCATSGAYCVDGRCEATWFENFEDARLDGWTVVDCEWLTATLDPSAAAQSAKFGLQVDSRAGSLDHYVRRTFVGAPWPRSMRWRVQSKDLGALLAVIHLRDANDRVVCYLYSYGGWHVSIPGTIATFVDQLSSDWQAIELLFDWDAETFDVAIDGEWLVTGRGFRDAGANGIHTISLSNDHIGKSWWDDFEWSE